jgi:hypothetical protein
MGDSQKEESEIAKLLRSESAKEKIKQTFEGKVFHSKPEKSKVKCVVPNKEHLKVQDKEKLIKW